MSDSHKPELFDAVLRVDQLPAAGRHIKVSPSAEELERLRELMGVSEMQSFSAELLAEKMRGGIHVTGKLAAKVSQPCVVTFEPVEQVIEEDVDRVFMPGEDRAFDAPPGSETFIDLEADDIPDHFQGPELDLSPLLLEVLGLAIDLYPRAEGAELPEAAVDDDEDEVAPNPFAALKALKSGGEGES